MNKVTLISTTLLILILLQRCDTGVTDSILNSDNLVSVSSFISPQDTVVTAYIFQAQSLHTTANPASAVISDALIYITDGKCFDTLNYQEESLRYETGTNTFSIQPLKTYYLRVILKSGQTLDASCIVPDAPENPVIQGAKDGDDYRFTVVWNSPPFNPYTVLSTDAIGTYEAMTPSGPATVGLSARLDNAGFILSNKYSNSQSGLVRRAYLAKSPQLIVYVRSLDRNMFLYYDSFRRLDNWMSNNGNLIPNFREPAPLFSNIDGGVGIFAAYQTRQINVVID